MCHRTPSVLSTGNLSRLTPRDGSALFPRGIEAQTLRLLLVKQVKSTLSIKFNQIFHQHNCTFRHWYWFQEVINIDVVSKSVYRNRFKTSFIAISGSQQGRVSWAGWVGCSEYYTHRVLLRCFVYAFSPLQKSYWILVFYAHFYLVEHALNVPNQGNILLTKSQQDSN